MSPQQFEQILSAFRPLIVWNASSGGTRWLQMQLGPSNTDTSLTRAEAALKLAFRNLIFENAPNWS